MRARGQLGAFCETFASDCLAEEAQKTYAFSTSGVL